MQSRNFVLAISSAALAAVLAAVAAPDDPIAKKELESFKGTWTGTSKCVGDDHPACKDEIVVYRFVPFTGVPYQLRCLGDKIIEGKRVPMGALMFAYDDTTNSLRCEYGRGTVHGIWSFYVDGDSMTGDLVILPGYDKVRDVRVRRVKKESEVPPAPALKEYEE